MSSAFLDVLLYGLVCVIRMPRIVYIEDNPEEPGVKCLRIELSLSPAILYLNE
jgi:hypothetical protein